MDTEVELFAFRGESQKPKRRFFLYQQVAIIVLVGILLIGLDFFTGKYNSAKSIETRLSPYLENDKVLFKYYVITEYGQFRCEGDFFNEIVKEDVTLEAKVTDWLNIPVNIRQKSNHDRIEYFIGIYWPFFFFPLLGLLSAMVSLSVRTDNSSDLGFKFGILASLMLAISYMIIFFTKP